MRWPWLPGKGANTLADNIIAIFERMWAVKDKAEIAEGQILTAQAGMASVILAGSTQPTRALYDRRDTIIPGDSCFLIRSKRTAPWVIAVVLGKPLTGTSFATPGINQTQLSPPNGVQIKGKYVEWQAPPQYPVAFEIQTSDDMSEIGATTHLVTRGSYFFLDTLEATYVRIRSVGLDFRKSAWSEWLAYSPPISASILNISASFVLGWGTEVASIETGSIIERVLVHVTQANNGTSPTLKVGVDGDDDLFMTENQNDSTLIGSYETQPFYEATEAIVIKVFFSGIDATTGAGTLYLTVREP
jgi:hypothetical protein